MIFFQQVDRNQLNEITTKIYRNGSVVAHIQRYGSIYFYVAWKTEDKQIRKAVKKVVERKFLDRKDTSWYEVCVEDDSHEKINQIREEMYSRLDYWDIEWALEACWDQDPALFI